MTIADWIGVLGGITGLVSTAIAVHEWRKVNRKIAMLTDAGKAVEVVPAWYTSRMMDEHWLFGLLVGDGRVIAIKKIKAVSDDGQWMDVELAEADEAEKHAAKLGKPVYAVAPDRTTASIRVASVVAAVDLWTS
jgi:hypothetical protein